MNKFIGQATLQDILLKVAHRDDLVVFNIDHYYVGSTIIDSEDEFIHSLNPKLLQHKVESCGYETPPWTTKSVLVVNLTTNAKEEQQLVDSDREWAQRIRGIG